MTAVILFGTVQAGNASGFNPWPSVISPVSLAEYAPDSPQSNSGDLTLAASNTGGDRLAVVILNFQGFDGFSAVADTQTGSTSGHTAASPFNFSMSGAVEIDIWLSTGDIKKYMVYQSSGRPNDWYVKLELEDSVGDGKWMGDFHAKIKAGELTSLATSGIKALSLDGFPLANGGNPSYTLFASNRSGSSGATGSSAAPAPAKYSGPEFSGLSGMGIMTGSTGKLEGKRLNEISSIEIGGKAATFTATSAEELELALPAGLAPGLYDLVINSSAGKLTQINAIQVREPRKSFSITTRSTGKISNDQYIEHSLIASMQIPELDKARCIVNASSMAMAQAMANRLCAVVKASNPNIETTIVEPRTTVKGDAVYARVTYGWN